MTPILPIPDGWTWAPLGEIAEVVGGVTKDTKKQSDPTLPLVPYLRVANVQRGRLDLSSVAEIRVPEATAERLRLQPGDVLLNEGGDRDKLGRGWVWEGQVPNCIHQNHVFRARIRDEILHPKLLAWFANECAKEWFEKHGKQTTNLASISLSNMKRLPVPVPPLDEQKRLLDALDEHLSRLDGATSYLNAAHIRLEPLISSAIRSQLERAPHRQVSLDEVLGSPLINGRSVPTREGGFPVLRLTALSGGRVDLGQAKPGDWTINEARPFLVESGDFLIARGNGSLRLVGRGGLVEGDLREVAFPDTIIRVRARRDMIDPSYFSIIWNSSVVRRQIESSARTTAGIYKVNQKGLRAVRLPLPSLDFQMEIVSAVRAVADMASRVTGDVVTARKRIATLRRATLMAAYTGQLAENIAHMDLIEELAGV